MITLQHKFPESTSRTQTHEIEIEKLKEISSVSVNTGYVSVTSVVDDLATLQFAGGSYSRRVLTGGSYMPSDSITFDFRDKYGRTTSTQYNVHRWDGASWKPDFLHHDPPVPSATLYYSSGGYTGTLSRTLGYTEQTTYDYPSNPEFGDIFVRYALDVEYYYIGTVTKPASDTRTWRYYYQYTATINYLEKSLNIVYKTDGELRDAYQGWVLIDNELREIDNMKKLVDGELKEC